ncbi:ATP synthase F1 subunit delta [Candidatus Synchoanobacter obligatus]|uniref:ATP synthase F1 subunit delta n=1 Tax=Candidatus Synchoanobacter obligatus TaxID=2919597 RepID=A0ABT1L4T2_9GAMM|nr:ATP synthase F1 subunit delta [Candidatus Synchoanobacter obligatus]MCP8352184.1 ATP synthase F1 subunit delta [Candidatus Synchoanobacter obligatus]
MKKTSRAYAKAAFDTALETQALDEWLRLIELLKETAHPALKNPQVAAGDILRIFTEALAPTATQSRWLALLAKHRHIHLLPNICKHFVALAQKKQAITPVTVVTARTPTAAQKKNILAQIERSVPNQIDCSFVVKPEILGGIQIELNGKRIDMSIAATLNQLHTET